MHMIHVTDSALKKISVLMKEQPGDDLKFRVYIIGGGCSGFEYGFSLEDVSHEDDILTIQEYNNQKITVLVDMMSMQYLSGSTVDYIDNLSGARFVVTNPNAKTTCGCGSSFSV